VPFSSSCRPQLPIHPPSSSVSSSYPSSPSPRRCSSSASGTQPSPSLFFYLSNQNQFCILFLHFCHFSAFSVPTRGLALSFALHCAKHESDQPRCCVTPPPPARRHAPPQRHIGPVISSAHHGDGTRRADPAVGATTSSRLSSWRARRPSFPSSPCSLLCPCCFHVWIFVCLALFEKLSTEQLIQCHTCVQHWR
jgi:hypothetical protein